MEPYVAGRPDIFQGSVPTLQGFYHAYSLVSSRAFMVDAFHGLSMVPIADAYVFFFLNFALPGVEPAPTIDSITRRRTMSIWKSVQGDFEACVAS